MKINVITLDEFCKDRSIEHINILKIDTEGYDLKVLKGASDVLSKKSIDLIYTELFFIQPYIEGHLFHEVCSSLYNFGYNLFNIFGVKYTQNNQLDGVTLCLLMIDSCRIILKNKKTI
ncbi:MAG: FkbM family methyltransferase [Elusimicrobiota bacterium]|nr:FkbM family methyltransferase [Endomicrobiia bacterium]MDW8166027.1 FkbM family methyltransferase [Elusimicrobiota bacterium]